MRAALHGRMHCAVCDDRAFWGQVSENSEENFRMSKTFQPALPSPFLPRNTRRNVLHLPSVLHCPWLSRPCLHPTGPQTSHSAARLGCVNSSPCNDVARSTRCLFVDFEPMAADAPDPVRFAHQQKHVCVWLSAAARAVL